MKLIDHKGRIFGLINLIDLAVLILLLSFIPLAFLGYNLMNKEKNQKYEWVAIKIKFSDIDPEFNDIISKGDVDKDSSGGLIGKLSNIKHIKQAKALLGQVDYYIKEDAIVADAEILCRVKGDDLFFKGNSVKIGNPIIFTTRLYNIKGLIVGLSPQETPKNGK